MPPLFRSSLSLREVSAQDFANVARVSISDEHALTIELRDPDVLFPHTLSQLFIPDSEAWNRLGAVEFASRPIGTGPFNIDDISTERVQLSAHVESWRAPQVDSKEYIVLPESASRLNGLLSDQLDIAFGLSPDDLTAFQNSGTTLYTAHLPAVLGFIFVTTKTGSPLQNRAVRQALNYAVNVEEIVDAVLAGQTVAASQPAHRKSFGYAPDVGAYGYDPERALQLLAEAGYPNGFTMTAEVTLGSPTESLVYQKIASDLRSIGVDLTLQTIPYGTFVSHFRTGNWAGDAFNLLFSSEPNLDALRSIRYHSCMWPAGWYCDQGATPLIESAKSRATLEERRSLTQSVMARYHEQAPAIFLYEFPFFFGLSEKVEEFSVVHSFVEWDGVRLSD